MKAWIWRVGALLLVLTLALSAVACNRPANEDPTPDPNGDGQPSDTPGVGDVGYVEPTLADHNPSQTYELTDYATLNMTDYIKLGRYRGLTLTLNYDDVTITDQELDSQIEKLLKANHPGARITDRAVEWGDTVVTDYIGMLDGVAFSGGSATAQTVKLTDNSGYIPGFAEGLVGATPGKAHAANVTFPEDYHATDLAGKAVVFHFTVNYIVGTPELDDAFVTEYTGGEYTDAATYREAIRQQMADEAYETALHSALWDAITENAAVEQYPTDAVLYYYDSQYDMYNYYAAMYGVDYDTFLRTYVGGSADELFDLCKDWVKEDMVYYAVFADGNYSYTDEQYDRALELYTAQNYAALNEEMLATNGTELSEEQARDYFDSNYRDRIAAQCLEESAYNDLIQDVTVVIEGAPEEGTAQ